MIENLQHSVPPGPAARQPLCVPSPEQIAASQLSAFIRHCEQRTGLAFADYPAFERFCIDRSTEFWRLFVDWSGMGFDGSISPARSGETCEQATFFPELRLNYADTLLRLDGDAFAASRPALTAIHGDGPAERLTRGELRRRAMAMSALLIELGLKTGDRISLLAHNTPGAIIAALGASGIGCTISSGSPDIGAFALSSRFSQTEPALLIAELPDGATALGAQQRERFAQVVAGLPGLRGVLLLDDGEVPPVNVPVYRASELLPRHANALIDWVRLPFNHPLFILFTSGTTGLPKCLVHGAGGTLIEHLKEHRLHCDLKPGDKVFFQTSTGWMMWNWLVSALASGCEIVLNNAPLTGAESLWQIVAREQINAFGTSPAYLQMCERSGWTPGADLDFSALRAMYSTGSILYPRQQDWVWQHVKQMPIQSISGGTDIVGCFLLGNPNLPAYSAEPQCRSLGLDVRSVHLDASGIGELVCANAFPSRPVGLLNDPDRSRFHQAYFAENEGMWTHGDLIELTAEGGARMHGRSDGVLNIRGIRIGPAEIYRILEDVPEIVEAMAVEQPVEDEPGGVRLVLMVVLKQGAELGAELVARIKHDLGSRGSPAHVPAVVLAVDQLPTTFSGKRSERSARDALSGAEVINAGALRNPECLEPLKAYAAAKNEVLVPKPAAGVSIEVAVAQIWQQALGRSHIGPDENYFDLGGDSYQAIQILAALRDHLGREVPMKLLVEAPTITSLAAALERPSLGDASPLVLLAPGQHAPPLFVIHGVGGSVMELRGLAQALQIDRAVYGVQARGLSATERPNERVEDMAREYLDAIRTVQPSGPYLLLGYSFGGWVAYEIARALRAGGEEVALLGILDTTPREQRWPAAAWREYFWRRLAVGLRQARGLKLHDWPAFWLSLWRSFVDRARRAIKPQVVVEGLGGAVLPEHFLRVREAGFAAAIAYQPAASDLEICLFRSDVRQSHLCDPKIVWSRLVRRVEVHDVPGNHLSMVRPPHLQTLAQQLADCIRTRAPLIDREGRLFESLEVELSADPPPGSDDQSLLPQAI